MFCPNCGKQCADEATFCGSCGYRLQQNVQPESVQPEPPVYTPEPPVVSAEPEKKFNLSKLVPVTFILTILLLAVSIVLPLCTDVTDIPVVKLGVELADIDQEIDYLQDNLEEYVDWVEEGYEYYEDEIATSDKRVIKRIIGQADELTDTFSLLNFRRFAIAVDDGINEVEEYLGYDMQWDEIDQVVVVVNLIFVGVFAFFLLPLIFTLLGGLLKSKSLTIVALVFMVLSQLILCGIGWAVLSMAVYITQAVFCSKAKK